MHRHTQPLGQFQRDGQGRIILDPGIDENDIDSFEWSPKDGIEDPNRLIISVAPKITTIYTLEVEYRGCVEMQEILILVKEEEDIYVGNVFSPDGNNDNDILYIKGIEDSTIELTDFSVYDRWGNKVFFISQPEFNNRDHGWDGMYHNTPVASGVFVYAIKNIAIGLIRDVSCRHVYHEGLSDIDDFDDPIPHSRYSDHRPVALPDITESCSGW